MAINFEELARVLFKGYTIHKISSYPFLLPVSRKTCRAISYSTIE